MNEKEIRLKCLELAIRFAEYKNGAAKDYTYRTDSGIVRTAALYEKFVKDGE